MSRSASSSDSRPERGTGLMVNLLPDIGIVVVIGSGKIGQRKVRSLQQGGFAVRWVMGVASPLRTEDIRTEFDGDTLECIWRDVHESDLAGARWIVVATGDPQLHKHMGEIAHDMNALFTDVSFGASTARFSAQQAVGRFLIGVNSIAGDPTPAAVVKSTLKTLAGYLETRRSIDVD